MTRLDQTPPSFVLVKQTAAITKKNIPESKLSLRKPNVEQRGQT